MSKLRVLDCFAGIGGFSLGLERTGGFETVAFCEIEPFCRKVLRKHWPDVPIYEDIRELRGGDVGPVDLICGGYPCQPFSHAGQRRGAEDDRHLWPEMYRLVDELRPAWVIGENVAGHVSMGLDDVLSDLEAIGYTARPFVIPACAVDARHRRDRVWTVAHASGTRTRDFTRPSTNERWQGASIGPEALRQRNRPKRAIRLEPASEDVADAEGQCSRTGFRETGQERDGHKSPDRGSIVANTPSQRQQGQGQPVASIGPASSRDRKTDWLVAKRGPAKWSPEPSVGRVAHGVPNRVDRLKALGNAVVPQIPELIGHAILQAHAGKEAA